MRGAPTLQPRLWLNALWTIPQVDLHSVDPVARWLIIVPGNHFFAQMEAQ